MEAERMIARSPLSKVHVCLEPASLFLVLSQCEFYLILVPGRQDLNFRAIKIIQKKSFMGICYHTPVISILQLALDVLYKSG